MRYFCFLLVWYIPACFAQHPITSGVWANETNDMHVQFYEKNDHIFGRVVWLRDSLDENNEIRRDIYNDNPKLRSRKLIDMDILLNLKGKRNGTSWNDGTYYSFENGGDYNTDIKLEGDALYIKGYWWLFKFLGRTKKWHRVEE